MLLVFRNITYFFLGTLLILSFQNCDGNSVLAMRSQVDENSSQDETSSPNIILEEIEEVPTKGCDFNGTEYQCVTIAYGSHELQHYELWLPNFGEDVPLVVYVHGGGYFQGEKEMAYNPFSGMKEFLEAGYAFASINYRLSGDSPFVKGVTGEYPPAMRDGASAIQDMRMRAKHYGINGNQVALTGGSAGGGISLWLALHDDLKDLKSSHPRDHESSRVQCLALTETQTTLTISEVARILGEDEFELDVGIPALYGTTPEEYLQDPEGMEFKLKASMQEASPISHLSMDDQIKLLLAYRRSYGEVDIHSPEFGDYFLYGKPNNLSQEYSRKSLSDIPGAEFELKVNVGSYLQLKFEVVDFIKDNCFR